LFRLFNISGYFSVNPVIETVSAALSAAVLLALTLIISASKIKLGKGRLIITLCMLPIYKINYADITNIREFTNEKELIIGYIRKNNPEAINILIHSDRFELFIKNLREKNSAIISDVKEHK
jgi:hypothetical protein